MHLVTENGLRVRSRHEIEAARIVPELLLQHADELVPIHLERLLFGPDLVDELERRVVAAGLDDEHAPCGSQRTHDRREHLLDLEFRAHAGPPGLRRKREIVVRGKASLLRNHPVHEERMILPVKDEHGRPHIHRVARLLAGADLPAVDEEIVECRELLAEGKRRRPFERDLAPVQRRGALDAPGPQPRRFGVVEIGDDDAACRVLHEAVRQLLEREAHVLDADLLADDEKRHRRKALVHGAHQMTEHRAVANACVEDLERRRRRPEQCQLLGGAFGDLSLLVRRVDEGEILLPVVVEAKRPVVRRIGFAPGLPLGFPALAGRLVLRSFLLRRCRFGSHRVPPCRIRWRSRRIDLGIPSSIGTEFTDISPDPGRGFECYSAAASEPAAQFAIIDGLAAESRLRYSGTPTEGLDIPQQGARLGLHAQAPPPGIHLDRETYTASSKIANGNFPQNLH